MAAVFWKKLVGFLASIKWTKELVLGLVVLGLVAFSILYHVREVNRLKGELTDARNALAEAQGSVEIAEGVQLRLAEEGRRLNRRIEEILGENTRLLGAIRDTRGKVEQLTQVNARLSERLEFSSNTDGTATVTVVERVYCPGDETTPGDPDPIDLPLPNIRVDFDLASSGFQVQGWTETSPPTANLSLTQIDPFVIDLAVLQGTDGTWQALASEQTNRLELEIGEFAVNPYLRRERWYERFGLGLTVVGSTDAFQLGPALSFETSQRFYVSLSPIWNLENGNAGAAATLSFRPFRRRNR